MKELIKNYVKDLTPINYSDVEYTEKPSNLDTNNLAPTLFIRSLITAPPPPPPPQIAVIDSAFASKNKSNLKEEEMLIEKIKSSKSQYDSIYDLVKLNAAKNFNEFYVNTEIVPDSEEFDIYIIGLGINPEKQLSKEAKEVITDSEKVFCVTTKEELNELEESHGNKFYDLTKESYKKDELRLEAYFHMASKIIEESLVNGKATLALYGHPTVFAFPPYLIHRVAKLLNKKVKIISGVSAMDCLLADLVIDPATNGMLTYEATDLLMTRRMILPDVPLMIWQVGTVETSLYNTLQNTPSRFKKIKEYLLEFYPASQPVFAYFANSIKDQNSLVYTIKLGEIEDYASILGSGITIYIPPAYKRTNIDEEILQNLNDKDHLSRITKQ